MMASTAENEAFVHTSPQILTTSSDSQDRVQSLVCDVEMLPVPEASSPELLLPLLVDEDMTTTTTSHDAILDQEFFPASTLDINGSARSHQGVQGTSSLPSSSEQLAFRAASSANHSEAVQPSNISNGGTTLNTPLANNPAMGQNPPRHLFNDPYEYELEKIRIEEDNLKKSVEEMTSQLMAELDRKMAEARSEFDRESQELDAGVMEVETRMGLVRTGSLLGNAFASKCSERSASNDLAAVRAMISQHSTQQQQAVQTNTQMSSTAPPRVRPQQEVQASTRMSTSAPPRPSVIALDDDPVPNSSVPLPHLQRRPTTQPSPLSQQTVHAHTHVNSTAPPRPSVTAVEYPILNSSSPMSQQTSQASHTHVNSTAPPRPSVTSVEDPMPNSSGPLPHLPPRTTTQTSLMSQQTSQASHTHVNSTASTPPSVTSVENPMPNSSGSLPHLPRRTTAQPSPMSQQTTQASHTHVNSTAPTPPSVEPQTPNNHLRPLVRFPRTATTQPSPMSQQVVTQSNTNVIATEALPRPSSVTTEALTLHSPLSNTSRPRPRPVISNLTPTSSPPVQGTGLRGPAPHIVRASAPHLARRPAPHLKQYGSSPAPISTAAAGTTHPGRSVQEQEQQQKQQQGKSNGDLVHLSDDED